MVQNDTKKRKKNTQNLYCEHCDFVCFKKSDMERHIIRPKHINVLEKIQNDTEKTPKNAMDYECECGKTYKYRSGLWRHKKQCETENSQIDKNNGQQELINYLLKENAEFKQLMLEQNRQLIELSKEKSITNNTNNSNNNTFNLQFFLNETCKNALNIQEFVSSIKPTLDDLENTGKRGYIEGIAKIIITKLKGLEQYQRPIHCSDVKREILYIKDANKWEKEAEEKPILTNVIKSIANENIKNISEWKANYPDCTDPESSKNNMYLKIVSNSMSGTSKQEAEENIHRIISKVAREVVIDK